MPTPKAVADAKNTPQIRGDRAVCRPALISRTRCILHLNVSRKPNILVSGRLAEPRCGHRGARQFFIPSVSRKNHRITASEGPDAAHMQDLSFVPADRGGARCGHRVGKTTACPQGLATCSRPARYVRSTGLQSPHSNAARRTWELSLSRLDSSRDLHYRAKSRRRNGLLS